MLADQGGKINGDCQYLKVTLYSLLNIYIEVSVLRFYDGMCGKVLPSLWRTEIILAILAFLMILAIIAGYIAVQR
jgi:hypothetical protein